MRGNFFESPKPAEFAGKTPSFFIQIPAKMHIEKMCGMCAGGEEDQRQRLMHMVRVIEKIQEEIPSLPLVTSEQMPLTREWNALLAAIREGKNETALVLLNAIPARDALLKAILSVHPMPYLQKLIEYSIAAKASGIKKLNADTIITPATLEILIHDIATTLLNPAKIKFSFGLPTHHAYSEEGSGFCILNKTAILLKHAASIHEKLLKYIIIGTDVNRDNGLCEVLMHTASEMDICHIDIFDSRVYPWQKHDDINKEFQYKNTTISEQNIPCWSKNQLDYYAVDLSLTTRRTSSVHPALLFSLKKLKETLEDAKQNSQKIMLFLPSGWDSHEDETAQCGKSVNGKMMDKTSAKKMRFNDMDLIYFYQNILSLYMDNKEYIEEIYWGLEGGYDRCMYERQIQFMFQVILPKLMPENDLVMNSGILIG